VDSGLSYFGDPTDTFSGLDHLDNRTVSVYADGVILSDEVVVGGEVTIDTEATQVVIGLAYTSRLEIMPINVGPANRAKGKMVSAVYFDLFETGHMSYGSTSISDLTAVNFGGTGLDPRYELYTSDVTYKKFSFPYGSLKKQTVYIESDRPMPLTIRAILPELSQ